MGGCYSVRPVAYCLFQGSVARLLAFLDRLHPYPPMLLVKTRAA